MTRRVDIDRDEFGSIGAVTGRLVSGLREKKFAGGKITEPGIYSGLPMEVYHSDCCDGPSISSSGLRMLTPPNGCPLRFWDQSYLNPNRAPEEEKEHFSLGKAVHTLLLSEQGFRDLYVIRPAEWTDWRTKDAKAWREEMRAAGKTVLVPEDLDRIQGMAERIAADRTFMDLLQGRIERSIIWKDRTGVWAKSRPDVIPADGFLADLKTCSDASERGCQRSTEAYGYHIQLALAVMGLEAVTGRRVQEHVLLFIETNRPYAYNIKPVDNEAIHIGMRQCRAALNIFAECWEKQEWPTYFGSGLGLSLPKYTVDAVDREPSIPKEIAA